MKKVYCIFFLLLLAACYNDSNEIITSEDVAHNTSELTSNIKSISSHNASFDNNVDNTSCFSLAFPYQVYVNSELKDILSVDDLADISEEDNVDIVFPVNTNFYNYELHNALNQTDFNLITENCNENFNIISNPCLNFQYPIEVKEYNDFTESFESYQLNNDKEVYLHFDNLHDNDVYEMEYPIFLVDNDSNSIRISSNAEFIEVFNSSLESCN